MSNTIYNKITINNDTLIDLSQDTVTSAAHIVSGHVGHLADGTQVTGTASDNFIITLSYNSTSGLYEPNETFSAIQAAHTAGKVLHLTGFDEDDEWLDTVCGYSASSNLFWYEVVWNNYNNNLIYWDYCILNANGLTLENRTTLTTPPTLQTKNNITPNTSSQTITPDSGYDGLSSVQINAMPSGTAGTPSATKGTVSNHQVSITPSVTNTTGYITGGTKTGTAVTVSASELVSGNKEITNNGTNIDVANYSTVSVSVASGGGGMNVQYVTDGDRVNTTSYSAVSGQSITVAVSGKYTVSWTGFRSSTGGTNGSQLYIDGTAHGNANTAFSNHIQINELTNITLNKNQVVTVRARARGTSYYMYVSNLTIQQTA